jgi:putative endonuclease
VGDYGERLAQRYLVTQGMTLLGRGWRCGEGEIDIVARERDVLVFCEVKTRSGARYGAPAEAVTARKAQRLRRLAYLWLQQHPGHVPEIRFDVVGVVRPRTGAADVEHVRGAF